MSPRTDRFQSLASGGVSVAILLAAWQAVVTTGLAPSDYLPSPLAVAQSLVSTLQEGRLWPDEIATCVRAIGGLIAATLLGIGTACITTRYAKGALAFDPVAEFIRPLPPAAIIPLSIYFFGLRWPLYAFIVVFACFWPVYLNAARAMHATPLLQVQTARSFGYSGWSLVFHVQLAAALPDIFIGIRQAGAISLIATIVTEMLAGQSGLGFFITDASMTLQIPDAFAALLIIMLDGVLIDALILALRRALIGWHEVYSTVRT